MKHEQRTPRRTTSACTTTGTNATAGMNISGGTSAMPMASGVYGNNVPYLAVGHYTLKPLISPPVSARHLECARVWQKQHAVVEHFTWKPST